MSQVNVDSIETIDGLRDTSTFVAAEVQTYLETGYRDPNRRGWPGSNFLEQEVNAERILRDALIDTVQKRLSGLPRLPSPPAVDLVSLTRAKVMPMVNGLFAVNERPAIMKALEASVIFLTPRTTLSPFCARRLGSAQAGIWPICTFWNAKPSRYHPMRPKSLG